MNIVLLLAHSVEEHDQVKLLSGLGYDVFSIGAYSDPAHPGDDKRPALPDAPDHPELREACHRKRVEHLGENLATPHGVVDPVDWAKADLPDEVLDWADAIIVHHLEHTWLVPQWPRLKASGKRIIWRTVGQSVENNERMMAPLHREGLEIVRYSPKELNIPGYAGSDALIRFYADPAEWHGWTGQEPVVINITQNLFQRHPYTNFDFWDRSTAGMSRLALGPGSEEIGGPGALSYFEMQGFLRTARCYLYTGTQPASYTLGLIEALMTGIPVVSIGPAHMSIFGGELFEGHELASMWFDDPEAARGAVGTILADIPTANDWSRKQRINALATFGKDIIGKQWASYLGATVKVA